MSIELMLDWGVPVVAGLGLLLLAFLHRRDKRAGKHQGLLGGRPGRHRGVFAWDRVTNPLFKYRGLGGFHRGRYVEDPSWRLGRVKLPAKKGMTQLADGSIVFNGTVTLGNKFDPDVGVVTLFPPAGMVTVPPLIVPGVVPGQPPEWSSENIQKLAEFYQRESCERAVREVVQDELASTPVWTGLRYGSWGDLAHDRADSLDLCVAVETGDSGSQVA
jgi:hypothetical protein